MPKPWQQIVAALFVAAPALLGSSRASAGTDERVLFTFAIMPDDAAGQLDNIRYTFGDELVDQVRPHAIPGINFQTFMAQMKIPETFDVSWETADGAKHAASVPVRSRLHESIRGKILHFVLQRDAVEGYLEVLMPGGLIRRERRFY